MILPIPFSREIEVKKISTNTVLDVYDEAKNGNIFNAMQSFLLGCITIDGKKPSVSEIKNFPLVNVEFLIVESFKKFGLPTKVESVYICPRQGCGSQIIFEEKNGIDNRIDISELEINYCDEENYLHEFDINHKINNEIIIDKMFFRDITIGDMIEVSKEKKSTKQMLNDVFFKCLQEISFYTENQSISSINIKNRYRAELFNFENYSDSIRLQKLFRKFGYNLYKEISCSNCGKQWKQAIDFTGFFVYALSCIAETS